MIYAWSRIVRKRRFIVQRDDQVQLEHMW